MSLPVLPTHQQLIQIITNYSFQFGMDKSTTCATFVTKLSTASQEFVFEFTRISINFWGDNHNL